MDLFFCDNRNVAQDHIKSSVYRSEETMNKTNVLKIYVVQ